jgi:uncharacterized membrane protein
VLLPQLIRNRLLSWHVDATHSSNSIVPSAIQSFMTSNFCKCVALRCNYPRRSCCGLFRLAEERTFEQDPKYPIRLLVDIAIKALSPAVNDPTTAVQAIDQLEDLLRRLGRRSLADVHAQDSQGIVRLIYPTPNWEDFLRLSFDEIRQYGAGSVQVMRRLRSALAGVAESISEQSRIDAVKAYVHHLDLVIARSPFDPEDRAVASQQDRQGLGLSRPHGPASNIP